MDELCSLCVQHDTATPKAKVYAVVLRKYWEVLLRHYHISDPVIMVAVRDNPNCYGKDNFRQTLEVAYRATTQFLMLDPSKIAHGIVGMVHGVWFATRDYWALTTSTSMLLFFFRMLTVAENICTKARLWDKTLSGNI